MAKTRKKDEGFPAQVYVVREAEWSGEKYLAIAGSVDEIPQDGTLVGVYELVEVKRLTITRVLE